MLCVSIVSINMERKLITCLLPCFSLWMITGAKGIEDPEPLPVLLVQTVKYCDIFGPENVTLTKVRSGEGMVIWKETFITEADYLHVGANAHRNIICWTNYTNTTLVNCLRDDLPAPPFELPRRSIGLVDMFLLLDFNPLGDHLVWQEPNGGGIFLTNLETQASVPLIPQNSNEFFHLLDMDWANGVVFGVRYVDMTRITMVTLRKSGSLSNLSWESPDGNPIWGIACHPELETIYWVTFKYLYAKSYYGDDVHIVAQDFDWIPVNGSFRYHGSQLYWLEGASEAKKVLKVWRISDGNEVEAKIGFEGQLVLSAAVFEDESDGGFDGCAKFGCSHICRPYYKGNYECACPWGLELVNDRSCGGKSVAAVAVDENVANVGHLFVRDMATVGFNNSYIIGPVLNVADIGIIVPDFMNKGYCYVEKRSLKVECPGSGNRNPSSRPQGFQETSEASMEVFFMEMAANQNYYLWLTNSSGCLQLYDSRRRETWTLTCIPTLKLQGSAVDSGNWIIFWTDSVRIFKTQVWSNITTFATLYNLTAPPASLAVDSKSKTLFWINGYKLNCSKYDGGGARTLYTFLTPDEQSAKNLVFNANRLYWIEDCEYGNCIFIFDVALLTREKLFNGKSGEVFHFLAAQTEFDVSQNSACASSNCSHFCAPAPSGRDSFTCWCPLELPFLSKRRTCKVPNFVIASYSTEESEAKIAFNYGGLSTFPVFLRNETVSLVKIAASGDAERVCYSYGIAGQMECAGKFRGKYKNFNINERISNLRLLEFNTIGDEKYWSQGNDTLCVFLGKMTSSKSMQVVRSANVYDVNSFTIDTAGKVVFWCDSELYIRYFSMLSSDSLTVYSRLNWNLNDGNCNCTSLAVDSFEQGIFVIVGHYIVSVPYLALSRNREGTIIHFINYGFATELQFHSGYLFWIGGESMGGEFIDMLRLPNYYGSAVQVNSSWGSRRIYALLPLSNFKIFQIKMYEQVLEDYYWENECVNPNSCSDFCFAYNALASKNGHQCFCPPHNFSTPEESVCATGSVWTIPLILIIAGGTILIFGVIVAVASLIMRKYRKRRTDTVFRSDVHDFLNGALGISSRNTDFSNLTPSNLPFTAIIPPDEIQIDLGDVLGDGNYGIVYKASFRGQPVAAKTFKSDISKELLADFMREIKVMAYVGHHENILEFLGAETSRILEGVIYVIVEYSPLRSLDRILRTNAKAIREPSSASDNYGYQNVTLGIRSLVSWSIQIARGMRFLEEKRVVHGDLATRNILVFDNCRQVKISDFGFARNLYQNPSYRKRVQCPLPFRWCSIETLHHFEFSSKADVWSYGVTVWEIFELGGIPFVQRGWDEDFANDLRKGLRLSKPELASDRIYDEIMIPCWQNEPEDRPKFKDIVNAFENIQESVTVAQ